MSPPGLKGNKISEEIKMGGGVTALKQNKRDGYTTLISLHHLYPREMSKYDSSVLP